MYEQCTINLLQTEFFQHVQLTFYRKSVKLHQNTITDVFAQYTV